jgi:mono/diheme cytochrome c family protein
MRRVPLALAAALALTLGLACGDDAPTAEEEVVALGREVYATYCAACHGPGGEGESPDWRQRRPDGTYFAPPHDSSGHTWHHADGLLFRIVRDGGAQFEFAGFTSRMPAFGDQLSDEEIRAVITYLKTLWGPREREFQERASEVDPFP